MAIKLTEEDIKQIQQARMSGRSIKQIVALNGFSAGTVSKYVKGLRINNQYNINNQKLATKTYKENMARKRAEIKRLAIDEWSRIRNDKTIYALVCLYWAEGTKRTKNLITPSCTITNSDPGIIRIALDAFLKIGCSCGCLGTDIWVRIYPGQDKNECANFWHKVCGRPVKVRVQNWRSTHRKIYSKYGVCSVRVEKGFDMWHKIMAWIECLRAEYGSFESCQNKTDG